MGVQGVLKHMCCESETRADYNHDGISFANLLFISGFIVIWFFIHKRLDGDKQTGECLCRTPCWALPCPVDKSTSLSVMVKSS